MKLIYFALIHLFTISWTAESNMNHKSFQFSKEPQIHILSPKDGEVIKDDKIVLKLHVVDFDLVAPDKEPVANEGHVQVWIDNMEFRGSKTEFVFENESDGEHTIKAELMLSNHTVLPYSKTVKVIINKT